jgi:hypothetical protein
MTKKVMWGTDIEKTLQDASDARRSELTDLLTCTMCGERQETHSEIVYSQGSRVCLDCKKITLPDDKRSFDRDMRFR